MRLTTTDFTTDAETLARRLIGTSLVRTLNDGTQLMGTIVETEAYLGVHDRAAHYLVDGAHRETSPCMRGRHQLCLSHLWDVPLL